MDNSPLKIGYHNILIKEMANDEEEIKTEGFFNSNSAMIVTDNTNKTFIYLVISDESCCSDYYVAR